MPKEQRVLVIDDDDRVGRFIQDVTEELTIPCVVTRDSDSFFRELTPQTTLIMLDLIMPNTDGIELLRLLSQQGCRIPIALMSGIGKRIMESAEQLAASLGLTVVGRLAKPLGLTELEALLLRRGADFEPALEHPPANSVFSDDDLRSAVAEDQFTVHYQPQVAYGTNQVVGVEALARWQHPRHGLFYPRCFLARLEALGLIDPFCWLIVRRSLPDYRKLVAATGLLPMLSLNVSVLSLRDLTFPDRLLALLGEQNIPPEHIILEITETGLIQELSSTLDVLTRLRMKGIQLSIDDFGTGYAMLQQLRHIPATELKIDMSFVQNMHLRDSDRVSVQKTIEIGHDLGMHVVAEGVESFEQLEFLRANGCDIVQGYLFSRPLPLDPLLAWIKRHQSSPAPVSPSILL